MTYIKKYCKIFVIKQAVLVLLFLSFIQISLAQNIFFSKKNYTDSVAFEKNMPLLAKQLIAKYTLADETQYFNNLFRLHLVAGNYNAVNTTLKKLAWLDHADSVSPTGLGVPYRLYSNTLAANEAAANFANTYTTLFEAYYASLKDDDKNWMASYFENDVVTMYSSLAAQKKRLNVTDSIAITDAVQLCRIYCNCKTYAATGKLGNSILTRLDNEKYFIDDSVLIKMPDGGSIALTIVRDKKNTAPQPVVMMYNIYAGKGITGCKEAATSGYIGIEANTRGKRLSADTLQPFEYDAKDAYYIIDWISKQPWCNGKVGMYGGSYLGFSQWSAVKYLHPALKTIVPQVAVGIGIDYPMHNNIFMSYMLRWIHYVEDSKLIDQPGFSDDKKWNQDFERWYKSGASFRSLDKIEGRPNKTFQRWLQHPAYDKYWQDMTPQQNEFSKINIPIFTTTGYRDDDQVGAMYYYKQYHQWNKNPNYYLLIGPYSHSGAQGYPNAEFGGYKIDSVANIPIMDIVFKWFDYILKDSSRPAILKDKVNFEIMGKNEWKHVATLDEMHNDSLRFYLGNMLAANRYPLLAVKSVKEAFIAQTVDLKDRTEVLFAGDNMGSYPMLIDTVLKPEKEKMIFVSDPVDKPFAISGNITASIVASINKKDIDIVLDLFELTADGKYFALVQNLQRASYANSRTKRQLLQPDKVQTINISNTYITSRQLQKGSRIIIVMGLNKNPNWQINYGTGKDVSDETIKDAAIPFKIKWYNSSYIQIPVLR